MASTARYDKYDPISGGFRAPLDVAWPAADVGELRGVGLNATGRVVVGAGNTGVRGVLVVNEAKAAGDIVDVMTHGEIVDVAGLVAGTTYYVNDATGVLETTAPALGANKSQAGSTVEATRLVVRHLRVQG